MKVKIKKLHPDAVTPSYAKEGDAALDLTAISKEEIAGQFIYDTGLAIEIPTGFVGLLFPRSSIHKTNLVLSNSVAVIDSGYRGSIKLVFSVKTKFYLGQPYTEIENVYKIGDRVAQLLVIPYPKIEFEDVEELSDTERGTGGFGSSGK